MDEQTLRELIRHVKTGRQSRRSFVQMRSESGDEAVSRGPAGRFQPYAQRSALNRTELSLTKEVEYVWDCYANHVDQSHPRVLAGDVVGAFRRRGARARRHSGARFWQPYHLAVRGSRGRPRHNMLGMYTTFRVE